jgi:hypothetical protein
VEGIREGETWKSVGDSVGSALAPGFVPVCSRWPAQRPDPWIDILGTSPFRARPSEEPFVEVRLVPPGKDIMRQMAKNYSTFLK